MLKASSGIFSQTLTQLFQSPSPSPSPSPSASQDMAQETFAYNIAEKVLLKLASLAFQEACLVCGVESNLERLKKILSTIKAVLLDAEEQQFHNQQIKVWLEKLIEVFYDAQDVVDEFERKAAQNQVMNSSVKHRKMYKIFLMCKHIIYGVLN